MYYRIVWTSRFLASCPCCTWAWQWWKSTPARWRLWLESFCRFSWWAWWCWKSSLPYLLHWTHAGLAMENIAYTSMTVSLPTDWRDGFIMSYCLTLYPYFWPHIHWWKSLLKSKQLEPVVYQNAKEVSTKLSCPWVWAIFSSISSITWCGLVAKLKQSPWRRLHFANFWVNMFGTSPDLYSPASISVQLHLPNLLQTYMYLRVLNSFNCNYRLAYRLTFKSIHFWHGSPGRISRSLGKQEQNVATF